MNLLGMIAYLLLGETNVGRRRVALMNKIIDGLPHLADTPGADDENLHVDISEDYAHLFQVGKSVNGFNPINGNHGHLTKDSNDAIDSMISDIDAAKHHVHLSFYIWLPDNNGCKMVEALKRAAARGVTCRAIADELGSRIMIKSEHWKGMAAAGVHLAVALPIGNPLLRPLKGRIDLRNHRKIVVVDGEVAWTGSMNLVDPRFFKQDSGVGEWVDAMARIEGRVVGPLALTMIGDWMLETDEPIEEIIYSPVEVGGLPEIVQEPIAPYPRKYLGSGHVEVVRLERVAGLSEELNEVA